MLLRTCCSGVRWLSSRPVEAAATTTSARRKVTILDIKEWHASRQPITMITAHDYPSAMIADKAGIDVVLVGDSLAMVALGYESTNQITMDEMLHHCRAVARGAKHSFLIGDMPFGSYQISPEDAVRNSLRFVAEGRMEAIKLEGGQDIAETVRRIVRVGIPVLGHIGLTPQTTSALGGFRVQGKTAAKAMALLDDARALRDAGCFSIVLEAVPDEVAQIITEKIDIPTIGIGAGAQTSGQVLVQNDALGVFDRFVPKFCKQYAKLETAASSALAQYHAEVKQRAFPAKEHCYPIKPEELEKFRKLVDDSETRHKS